MIFLFLKNKFYIFAVLFITGSVLFSITLHAQTAYTDLGNLKENSPAFVTAYDRIDIFSAWQKIIEESGFSFTPVTIGVIDTGTGFSHQEFSATTSNATMFGVVNFGLTPPTAKIDTQGHGTAVAGIIGANNLLGEGFSLLASSPQMNGILSGVANLDYALEIRKSGSGTAHTAFSIWRAMNSLDDSNAKLVNISLGNPRPTNLSDEVPWIISDSIFRLKFAMRPSIMFILAAGNKGVEANDLSPARNGDLQNVITVGATKTDDSRASFPAGSSNFGNFIALAAPGEATYAPHLNNDYVFFSGTSASAPLVTGVAGLIKAINPLLTPAQIKHIITTTADPIFTTDTGELTKTLGSACDDGSPNFRGCRLNALAAVCHPLVLDCTQPQAVPLWSTFQNDAQHTGRSSLVGPSFSTTSDVTVKWQAILDGPTEIQPLIAGDGTVYTLTAHTLQSFNGDTGAFLAATTTPGISQSFALGPDNTVYVCSRAAGAPITAYTPDLGEKKWTFFIGGSRECLPPIVSSDNIIYATVPPPLNGQTAVLAAINSNGTERFRYEEPNIAATSPALSKDETIVYVAFNKTLRAFSSKTTIPTPVPLWTQTDSFRFSFAPLIDDNDHIIMTDTDIGLRAYDMDGAVLWTRPIGNNLQNPPTLDQSGNILFSRNDTLFTVDPTTGAVISTFHLPGVPSSGRSALSVDGANRKYLIKTLIPITLLAIDADIVWTFHLERPTNAPAIGDSILYIVSDDVLYALGE